MLMRRFASEFYYLNCVLSYNYGFRGREVLVRVNIFTGMGQLWQASRCSWSTDITYHNLSEFSMALDPFYGPLPKHFYQEA